MDLKFDWNKCCWSTVLLSSSAYTNLFPQFWVTNPFGYGIVGKNFKLLLLDSKIFSISIKVRFWITSGVRFSSAHKNIMIFNFALYIYEYNLLELT